MIFDNPSPRHGGGFFKKMIIATIEGDRYTYYITEPMNEMHRRPNFKITNNFINNL